MKRFIVYLLVVLCFLTTCGTVSMVEAGQSDLIWSTYIGGTSGICDNMAGVRRDSLGYIYIAGMASSSTFPTTPGVFDTTQNGSFDVYVAKLTPDGSALVYSTFIGGTSDDKPYGFCIDSSGCVYVTGYTKSTDFPVTTGAFDTSHNGGGTNPYDAFVAKLSADGSSLEYCTFLGGNGYEYAPAICVDSQGCAYVGGRTESSNFPVTPGAFDTSYYYNDAFITKLNPQGSALEYSTFLGDGAGIAMDMLVDSSGCLYITGATGNSSFPTTSEAYDTTFNGGEDGYILKLNQAGSSVMLSTLLGGNGNDYGRRIFRDSSGAVYVAGSAGSATGFPITPGAPDTTLGGTSEAFIVKLSPDLSQLVYSTFLGGSRDDTAYGLAVDSYGCAYVCGSTYSTDFPTTPGAFDTTATDSFEVFITRINPAGTGLVYSTFLGGPAAASATTEEPSGLAIDGEGNAFVAGYTLSPDFPVTPGSFMTTRYPRGFIGFVSKLSMPTSFTISASTGGSVTPGPGVHVAEYNASIAISAIPDEGYTFYKWEGGVADPDSPNTTVTLDSSKAVNALFTVDGLGKGRSLPDGARFAVSGGVVTLNVTGGFYMQATDRSAGIKVVWPSAVSEGKTITVCGTLGSVGTGTSGVERVLNAEEVIAGTASEVLPVYLPVGKIGGHLSSVTPAGFSDSFGLASLYNLGLLVRTAGTLTYRDTAGAFFYLDDGSGLLDGNTLGGGSPVAGIKVILPSAGVIPPVGKKVAVTGVSSRDTVNGKAARVVRMRSHSDMIQTTGATIAGRISRYGSETVDQFIQSAHPYISNYNNTWTITPSPFASQIRVHFTKIELEFGCDWLEILDSTNTLKQWYNPYPAIPEVWSDWISGPSLKLHMFTNSSVNYYGFQMDKYEFESADMPAVGVTVTLQPGNKTTETASDGTYTFDGLEPGMYTVTPSLQSEKFTPSIQAVTLTCGEYRPEVNFAQDRR